MFRLSRPVENSSVSHLMDQRGTERSVELRHHTLLTTRPCFKRIYYLRSLDAQVLILNLYNFTIIST
jgi:hypothetical protein